jgi:hypothetical protein
MFHQVVDSDCAKASSLNLSRVMRAHRACAGVTGVRGRQRAE